MPRQTAQHRQHALVADAALGAQTLDQAIARALRGHALPQRFGLAMEIRRHADDFKAAVRPPTQLATVSSAW